MSELKKFGFDISIVFYSSIIKIIIGLLISIIIARYFGAGDLGLYRMVLSIYGVIMLFSVLGVPAALIKYVAEFQNNITKVNRIISSGIFISIAIGFISLVIFFIFSDLFGNLFNMPELPKLIRIISLAIPFSVIGGTLLATLNGFRRMKEHATAVIFQNILMLSATLLFIYLGYGVSGVVLGIVISSIGFCVHLLWVLRKHFIKINVSDFLNHSKTLLSFGSRTVIASSINIINYQADIIMIGYFLTETDVGYYSVAVLFAKFLWFIPDSIQTITYPMISDFHAKEMNETINQVVAKTMKYTACVSIIIGISMLIFAKAVITVVYGDMFIESVTPFYILIIGTMIFSVVKSVNSLFASIGRVDLFAKIPVFSAIFNIILNLLLIPIYGTSGAAMATATSLFIYVLVTVFYTKKILGIVYDSFWYIKAGILTLALVFVNNILADYITVYISGFLIILFGITLIWTYLLTSQDRKYFLRFAKNQL